MKMAVILAGALTLASGVRAQTAAPAPAPVTAPAKATPNPGDKVVCRTEEVLGSRLAGKKECHTKSEWDQMAADSRSTLERSQRPMGIGSH